MKTYTKPTLAGFSAVSAIQDTQGLEKRTDLLEPSFKPTDPAYQADE
jgi:hypothetical protein